MFKPARMTRLLLGGHKDHQEAVIDALHAQRMLHLEDFEDPSGSTDIGTPLEHGDEMSDLLVHARGLLKALGAEEAPAKKFAGEPRKALDEADAAIGPALDTLQERRNDVAALDAQMSALAPYAGLDVDLGALRSLSSVAGFIGTVRGELSIPVEHHLVRSGDAVAVVVAQPDRDAADKALGAAGFTPAQLPEVDGTPKDAIGALTGRHAEAVHALHAAEGDLAGLRERWGPRLASLERHLAAEVDKTQAPLRMAVTDSTFHVEGWVPVNQAEALRAALASKVGDGIYFETLGDAPRGHDEGHAHGVDVHAEEGHDEHHSDPGHEAPVKLENRGLAKPYEFMLGLLGRPRYWEIDPTKLMLIFFPLFFGLMVGDVLVGLAIMGMGLYLKKNHIFGIGGKSVGRALFMGGFIAVIAGFFVFGEALGIHFTVSDDALEHGEHSWEEIIYGREALLAHEAGFPTEGFIHKTSHDAHASGTETGAASVAHASAANGTYQLLAAGAEEEQGGITSILKPHGTTHLSLNGWVNLGYYSKIHDIQALLAWCIVIAVFHLNLAFLLGIRNVAVGHGVTLAIQEKLSWITAQVGLALAVYGGAFAHDQTLLAIGAAVFVASIALLWKGVEKALGAPGFVAILEFLGFFGNILSYTRLAAIGASKAGMALAFAAIGFDVIGGGSVQSISGWIVYLIGMVLITALAMLSGGLQSLRLQFVEFFGKFYEGGGRAYTPFGRRNP